MAQAPTAYLEINLSGGSWATELSGATNATFNTTAIERTGAGYSMLGMGGNDPDSNSDVMLIYDIKQTPFVEYKYESTDDAAAHMDWLLMQNCGVWIFGVGFFCTVSSS